jgi:glyoxylase-like metal-dependent hydrolase (beta-lactamase superfamily II)
MKVSTLALVAALLGGIGPVGAATPACWVEFSLTDAPGAMGAAGSQAQVWHNTASGLLISHPKGTVLIDAGWSRAAKEQMAELAPEKRPTAEKIFASLKWRKSAPEALEAIGHQAKEIRFILPTHAHYDHLAGAEDLPGSPILLPPEEIAFLANEEQAPDIVAASNIRAIKERFQPIAFKDEPYMVFAKHFDLYGDGSIVVVPLPGHTPGSIGVFATVAQKRVFAIGDATWLLEAVERNLPKIPPLRAFADSDGPAADRTVTLLNAFSKSHPEIAILPAHDRTAWESLFGQDPRCVE